MKRKTPMRRFVGLNFALLLMAISATGAWAAPPGYYKDQNVAYHNDGGGPDNAAYFRKMLNNLKNHVAALGKTHVQIRVVNHGDGVTMLQMANTDEKLAAGKAEGIQFLVCQNTLDERNIDWHTLYGVKQEDLVPSGVAELARLQLMGFQYIHP